MNLNFVKSPMTPCLFRLLIPCALLLLTACTVGPNYVLPTTAIPESYKEVKGWKQAQPQDEALPDHWWEIFHDEKLSALEVQVNKANQSIIQAEAQYKQAQTMVQGAAAAYFPTAQASATVNRFRAASGQNVAVNGVKYLFGTVVSAAWAPDLWGSVRRQV